MISVSFKCNFHSIFNCVSCLSIFCSSEVNIISCEGCNQMFYCSKSCKKKGWKKYHRFGECLVYQREGQKDDQGTLWLQCDFARYLTRFLLMAKGKPESLTKKYKTPSGIKRCFHDLKSHSEDKTLQRLDEHFQCLEGDTSVDGNSI